MAFNQPVVIHTDASRDEHVSGIGYTIHNNDNTLTGKKFMQGHYTSMEAEFHALVEAVRVASQQFSVNEGCEIYTDCKPLVRKVCGGPEARDDWEKYRQSAHWLLDKFADWDIYHVCRESNTEAHDLARQALKEGRGQNL